MSEYFLNSKYQEIIKIVKLHVKVRCLLFHSNPTTCRSCWTNISKEHCIQNNWNFMFSRANFHRLIQLKACPSTLLCFQIGSTICQLYFLFAVFCSF